VLVIEDHKDTRDMLTEVLNSLRAHVVAARNLAEAEHLIAVARMNLIICDMRLPDGTGFDFIRWLRSVQDKRIKNTPCIAVTGYEQQFPPTAAAGFDAYMRKPINLDKFCDVAVTLARR
jgi:CheY-like chemotaxis protein